MESSASHHPADTSITILDPIPLLIMLHKSAFVARGVLHLSVWWGYGTDLTLTHCSLVTPYGEILVNTDPDNGLLPDGTKPLPEPMLINHQSGIVAFSLGEFHKKCSRYLSLNEFENHHSKITAGCPKELINETVMHFRWFLKTEHSHATEVYLQRNTNESIFAGAIPWLLIIWQNQEQWRQQQKMC